MIKAKIVYNFWLKYSSIGVTGTISIIKELIIDALGIIHMYINRVYSRPTMHTIIIPTKLICIVP